MLEERKLDLLAWEGVGVKMRKEGKISLGEVRGLKSDERERERATE